MHRFLWPLALRAVLIASFLTNTVLVPLQMASGGMEPATAAADVDMPCHEPAPAKDPGSNCTPATCDLAACLGSACLPAMARLVPHIETGPIVIAWRSVATTPAPREPPLRPPIA